MRTFEKREKDAKRHLFLLVAGGLVLLVGSTLAIAMDKSSTVQLGDQLVLNRDETIAALHRFGYYNVDDDQLASNLAKQAIVDQEISDPYERAQRFTAYVAKRPLLSDLRLRALANTAPFQEVGDVVRVGVPYKNDQPPRYVIRVKESSRYAGRILEVHRHGGGPALLLYGLGGIYDQADIDSQLNYAQYSALFGDKARSSANKIVLRVVRSNKVFDTSCPHNTARSIKVFREDSCKLDEEISWQDIPRLNE